MLSMVFLVGYIAWLVLALNSQPQHTVLLPPGAPGELTSEIYKSAQYWVVYWMPVWKGMFLIFLLLMIAWGSRSNGCAIMFFVLLIAVALVDGIGFVGIALNASRCNGPDQKNNPCNDHLWCCVNGGGGPEVSGCAADPTTFPGGGCVEPIDMRPDIVGAVTQEQLKWNNDFKWLFHSGWMFLLLMIIFFMMAVTTLCWEPSTFPPDPMRDTFTVTGGYSVPDGGISAYPYATAAAMPVGAQQQRASSTTLLSHQLASTKPRRHPVEDMRDIAAVTTAGRRSIAATSVRVGNPSTPTVTSSDDDDGDKLR